ncbi:MAG: imidazolonepropionase [Acidobacteria bacterium]|nr:imidazolonepropionase [Acidobacteriota bacterium]
MLLLANIGQLVTLRGAQAARRGPALGELGIVNRAAVLCSGGKVISAGTLKNVKRHARGPVQEIDCGGRVVLPGFVDSHTHPVFSGPRLIDFEERIRGSSYEEIARRGGGIRSSLEGVRRAPLASLARLVEERLVAMSRYGTTTVEAKSGYGLDTTGEIKSLRAIARAASAFSGTVVPTFLGAHIVPPEFASKRGKYVRMLCEDLIPRVSRARLAAFVDVFCDRGAFTLSETRTIFQAAQRHGLGTRAHLGQLSQARVPELMEFGPASLDHMDHVRPADLPLLAGSQTVVTLLPGANYFLGLNGYAPARSFIDSGLAIALATDFNPGTSPTLSMPMIMSLACTHMGMSPAEAITAATINGAAALGLAGVKGSIEPGKHADLAIFNASDYREIAYWFGANHCWAVVTRGKLRLTAGSGSF